MGDSERKRCWLFALCVAAGGCGLEAVDPGSDCSGLSPGDLVISEVHANPEGADSDGEYVELYNASGSTRLLEGVTLVSSRADGTGADSHRFSGALTLGAGDYFVAGNASGPLPGHLDYSYGSSLGNLRNSDASLSLWCGEQLIDEMRYERTTEGRALELDGANAPDHELNDDPQRWCPTVEGAAPRSTGDRGTPGAPNHACQAVATQSTCASDGGLRPIASPERGQLRITEWMANPAGSDAELEWVEIEVSSDLDLNGLQLGPAPDSLSTVVDRASCFPVDAGTRVVFGGSPGAAPRVDAELTVSLGNAGPRSIVAAVGGEVLDRVDYDGATEGVAWQIDPDARTCLSPAGEYQTGNRGTPGEPNPSCASAPNVTQCLEDGFVRELVPPVPGQLRIVEWMANPTFASNRDGEWVELRVDATVDLNGLVLSDRAGATTSLQSDRCLTVPAGKHYVLARSVDPTTNGGIEHVDAELTISLNNTDETISVRLDEQVLDSVAYERSKPGIAAQIDELGRLCDAAQRYGDGDLGTPGVVNPSCF